MRDIDKLILFYRDPLGEYLDSHISLVWAIYILFLVVIVLVSYYIVFFNKSDSQKQIIFRSLIILNIVVAIVSIYEMTAPLRISMWFLVQNSVISLMILDMLYYISRKTIKNHFSFRIVLYIFCLLALITFVVDFVLVEIIPIIYKPFGSGLLA